MKRVLSVALACAGIITVVASAAIGASQAGRMDQMGRMGQMGQMNDFKAYTPEAFKAAMQEGKTTLLFFHAPWCPVCKAQEPKVQQHLNGAHKSVVAFKVDYDSNVPLRQQLKVDKQSTLILYQGMKEVARLSYKSDDKSIAEFFSHATMKMSGER